MCKCVFDKPLPLVVADKIYLREHEELDDSLIIIRRSATNEEYGEIQASAYLIAKMFTRRVV